MMGIKWHLEKALKYACYFLFDLVLLPLCHSWMGMSSAHVCLKTTLDTEIDYVLSSMVVVVMMMRETATRGA